MLELELLDELELITPLEELDDELLEELDDELLVTSPLEELEDDELLDELELLELDDEPVSSPPWVTKSPSPPQALKAATTKPTVSARKDFLAAPCNPIENMWNTPHKCWIRLHTDHLGWRYIFLAARAFLAAKADGRFGNTEVKP